MKTSKQDKELLDTQVAYFIYAKNTPFCITDSAMQTYDDDLRAQTVCVALDGWSNIDNEPILNCNIL